MPLNVTEEKVDKVNKRSDTGSSADNLCPQYSLRLHRSVVVILSMKTLSYPSKFEQLGFAKSLFSHLLSPYPPVQPVTPWIG